MALRRANPSRSTSRSSTGSPRDPKSRALYLYPTKALAQDQARKLAQLEPPGLALAIYDGDTPREERPAIRRRANLILTNPDMVSMGMLGHHKGWGDFLANLETVVVDEAHTYRGVFGSHVANVLRRLRRVARLYGSDPRFILASATIANPLELAERLAGTEFTLVDSDGAPRARRRIAIWNPPVIDEETMSRRSVLAESAELLADLVANGSRTICFLKSRRGVELILKFTRMRLEELGEPGLARRIAPYRAGYTPQQRREIEAQLARGELLAVVATDALELGIDIGELDAALCVTFPGTVASLRQMWGRAGRRSDGIAVYCAGQDALDQFFCRHPEEFLARPVEAAILDHENERIQLAHLTAAAYEAPLGGDASQPGGLDDEILGERWRERAEQLVGAGTLRRGRDGRYLPRGPGFPAGDISLRSASLDSVAVVDASSGELLGSVEAERAFSTVHPGAIYLHLGRSYEVRELDIESRRAVVEEFSGDWYTQPKKETMVFIEEAGARRRIGPDGPAAVELSFGEVSVTEQVIAYQRKSLSRPRGDRPRSPSTCPSRTSPPRRSGTSSRTRSPARSDAAGRPARGAPRGGAQPDRGAAAAGHVRPLGHRRPLDQHPLPDRPADDLHLRRPSRGRRHRPPRLRRVRAPGRRRRPARRRVPVRVGLPVVRPEPEVRQPQRAAAQGRGAAADGRLLTAVGRAARP